MNAACGGINLGQINWNDLHNLMRVSGEDVLAVYQDIAAKKLDTIKPFKIDVTEVVSGQKRKGSSKMPSSTKKPREAADHDASEVVSSPDSTTQNDTTLTQSLVDDDTVNDSDIEGDTGIRVAEFKPKMVHIVREGVDSNVVNAIEQLQKEATNVMHDTAHMISLQLLKVENFIN